MLDEWESWLMTPEGGTTDAMSAVDNASRLYVIGQYMSYSKTEHVKRKAINRLFTVVPMERKQTPGTVKAYVGNYVSFLKYLFLEKEISEDAASRARMCAESIRRTVAKEAASRQCARKRRGTARQ